MTAWIHLHNREPEIEITKGLVKVKNLRDYIHKDRDHATEKYLTKTYPLKNLRCVWFAAQPLHPFKSFSHTFFSFDFGKEKLIVSVEARRKKGQKNPVFWGFLPIFQILFTCTTEKDQLSLRSRAYEKNVYLYKLKLSKEESKKLLIQVAKRIKEVNTRKPKFNSVYRNCTTEILLCFEKALPGRFGISWKRYYNAKLEYHLYNRGLIDTLVSLEKLRSTHDVSPRVHSYKTGDFSAWIRKDLPKDELK